MLLADLRQLRLRHVPWALRYLFGRRNDRWYASLFEAGRGKVTGDMSASYAGLDRPAVGHAFDLLPDVKVIYGLRDPVDRAWSHALMAFDKRIGTFEKSQNERYEELNEADFIRFFESPLSRFQADYPRTLQIWEQFCPKDHFLTYFMEDIANRPSELLVEIYTFLGVDSSPRQVPDTASRKVRAGTGHPIPEPVRRYLARRYHPQILDLQRSKRFSGHQAGYVENWRKNARAWL